MSETYFRYAVRDDRETEVCVEIAVNLWRSAPQTYGPPES